ncbi:MAG TPA: MFS transporter [Acidimicrobiales bacterium]|nr:MFS transporter [Acidimicrobiales bacterium]
MAHSAESPAAGVDVRTAASRHQSAALATVCAVLFVTFLDNTVVSVTLADFQSRLHAGVTSLQWVVNGYALVFAALMLTGGTLGDLFGRKRIMLGGLVVFCAGSVVAALAPGTPVLIAGRAIMGVGAAASEPGTLSVLRHLYPDRAERARAVGVWAAVSGLALALGPVIAGVLVGIADWRAVFWFNLVFGIAVLGAAALVVPETSDPEGRSVDVLGLVFGAVALGASSSAVIAGEEAGYGTWWIVGLFVLAALSALPFVLVELHVRSPMLPLSFFRRSAFTGATLVAFISYFGIFSIFFFVALYVQLVVGQSPYRTALDFAPMAVLATTRQKEAARRRNVVKARQAQSGRSRGQSVPRRTPGMSTAEENQLPDTGFAFPKQRKEPLNDAAHVRNAIARFDQVEGVSDAERDRAWKRIRAAADKYDVDVTADDWRQLFADGRPRKH